MGVLINSNKENLLYLTIFLIIPKIGIIKKNIIIFFFSFLSNILKIKILFKSSMNKKEINEIEEKIKCKIKKKLGSGTYGDVYQAINQNKNSFALKIESSHHERLNSEMKIYKQFNNIVGIPDIYWYGTINDKNILALEYLGPTLEKLYDYCDKKFSLKTVLMIACQLIDRIKDIHSKNIIHRDLKPDNFLIGFGVNKSLIYIIDFGLSKYYLNNSRHIRYSKERSLTGSLRYASIRNHKGIEQSRRDDLESIGYILIFFLKGNLPWQGLKENEKYNKNELIYLKKRNTSLEVLCKDIPEQFLTYMKYCRLLEFQAKPDYDYLKKLFLDLFISSNFDVDFKFDWNVKINDSIT